MNRLMMKIKHHVRFAALPERFSVRQCGQQTKENELWDNKQQEPIAIALKEGAKDLRDVVNLVSQGN